VREHLDLSGGQRCARMLSVDLVLRFLTWNTSCPARTVVVAEYSN
jgi:hypothetical protein